MLNKKTYLFNKMLNFINIIKFKTKTIKNFLIFILKKSVILILYFFFNIN